MIRWFRKRKGEGVKREGASLVSVVIGVAFLATIGLTILTVASRYAVTVYTDRNSTDNFYQTEGILAEVRSGLLEYAGKSAEETYQSIMENYTAESKNMKDVFAKGYLSGIATAIKGETYTWNEADEKLGVLQPCNIDKLKSLTKVPEAVKEKSGTNLAFVINKNSANGYTLTIKNMVVDYTDSADYRSKIDTDIVFKVPDYRFEGDSTFDELKDYIVISDDALDLNGATSTGTELTGKIYTGQEDAGIQIDTGNIVKFNSKSITSRGSLDILTGADVSLQGESGAGDLWLQNIRLKSLGGGGSEDSHTKVSMTENAYISNDLDIEDSYAEMTLAGKYYGYSYNKNNDDASEKSADYSSAILVNGQKTTLDASNLDKMILAGRAFVSQNDSGNSKVKSEIQMGESLSPKSNQIAYLVPDQFLPGEHNPMATADLTAAAENSIKSKLLADASPVKKYLNSSTPYKTNYVSDGYVYLFLNFANEKMTNQYFTDYYTGQIVDVDEDNNNINSREELQKKAKSYLTSMNMTNNKFSGNLYLIAGNIVYNYDAVDGVGGMQSANYYDGSGKPKKELLDDGKKMALNYLGKCLTLLPSGSVGRDANIRLDSEPPLVANKIIDYSAIPAGGISKTDPESGKTITVADGNYDLTGVKDGILIAKGNVVVSTDFNGLIIAGGKVTVQGNRTLKYDMVTVGNLLEFAKKDPELSKIFIGIKGGDPDSTAVEECISYQNWEKNAY